MEVNEDLIKDMQRFLLAKTGILYFNKIKITSKDIMVSCPFHKQGQERKPSCGIKRFDDEKGVAGMCHCFSCGEQTTLDGMLQKVLGVLYNPVEVENQFHLKQLKYQSILQEKPKDLFELPNQQSYVKESLLKRFRGVYHPYLSYRGISQETALKYDIGYEDANKHITFPIKDIYNNCIGIGRRSILRKEYYYPYEMHKPLYGIYELSRPVNLLWIVEGPFNLWSLSQWGKQAVALLGTGTSEQYEQLKTIPVKGYILALDPDDAGRKGTIKLIRYIEENITKKIYVLDLPNGKDINDLQYNEFRMCEVLTAKEWQYKYKII